MIEWQISNFNYYADFCPLVKVVGGQELSRNGVSANTSWPAIETKD